MSATTLSTNSRRIQISETLGLLLVLGALCLTFAAFAPAFLSGENLLNIAQTLAVVGITAIGMTMVIAAGGIDISVGSVAALSGVVTSLLWTNAILPIGLSMLVGLLAGTMIGIVNGLVITRLRINPLITTLATFSIVRGLSFIISGGQTNQLTDERFQFLGRGTLGGIPFSLILMILLYLLFIGVMRYTQFGRNLYAIGSSQEASRLAGIAVLRHLLIVYGLCSLLAALAGLIIAAQLASSKPQTAVGLEFTVVAAVVLGGASLAGGKGSLVGTLIGVIILRILDNGLVLANVSSYYQEVMRGGVLLLAVGFDQLRARVGQKEAL